MDLNLTRSPWLIAAGKIDAYAAGVAFGPEV